MPYLNAIWTALAGRTGIVDRWPDFRFDPKFYARTYTILGHNDAVLLRHSRRSSWAHPPVRTSQIYRCRHI